MWFNPIMVWLLRSPLHSFVSKQMMVITYTGRKSGKVYATPVNYVRDGDIFLTTSFAERTWWRNLHGGAAVTLRVQGMDLQARSEVISDPELVAENLRQLVHLAPVFAGYFKIELDGSGNPLSSSLRAAAQGKVIVRCTAIGE